MINTYFVERHENKLYAAKKSDTRFKGADVERSHMSVDQKTKLFTYKPVVVVVY